VLSNIVWRIYDLGYSLEVFGEIDKHLFLRNFSSRGEENKQTDGYGQKYAWIAYFEL